MTYHCTSAGNVSARRPIGPARRALERVQADSIAITWLRERRRQLRRAGHPDPLGHLAQLVGVGRKAVSRAMHPIGRVWPIERNIIRASVAHHLAREERTVACSTTEERNP